MLNAAERSVAALAERDNLLAVQHDMHEYNDELTEHHHPESKTPDVSWLFARRAMIEIIFHWTVLRPVIDTRW